MADNLLEKASILLTPTAYNDGRMLSVKPENGDGDFTFSRGSAATRVNAQGLVENVQIISSELVSNGNFSQEGSELITNGDFATDSDWTKGSGWTISGGKATKSGTDLAYLTQSSLTSVVGKTYRVKASITNVTTGNIRIDNFTSGITYTSNVEIDITYTATSAGVFRFLGWEGFDGSIDNVSVKEVGQDWTFGTGWSVDQANSKAVSDGTSSFSSLYQNTSSPIGTKCIVKFDAVVNSGGFQGIGFEPFNQIDITSSGSYEFFTETRLSRFEFRTNSLFDGSITNISVKEITDDTDLPRIDYTDGCGSWLLEPQSTNLYLNSDTLVTQSNTTSASTYTVSFYGTGTITFSGTHTGTLVGTGTNDRVSATFTATAGTLTSTISGTCEKGQLENLPYATSYIPTNGAIATRLADVANNSGNSTLINSTEGVLYAEIAALADGGSYRIISLSDGSDSNRVVFFYDVSSNRLSYQVKVGSINQANGAINNVSVLQFNKIALKYKENDFAFWINGAEVATDTVGNTFPLSTLNKLSFSSGNGTSNFYGKTKALAVYKEALTDAQLQSLTTI